MTADLSARRFFFLLLAGSIVLMALLVRPLATPLFLATVIAVVLWPIYRKLRERFGNRPALGSAVVVLGVVLLLVAPVAGLSAFVVTEGSNGLKFISEQARSEEVTGLVKKLPEPFETFATDLLARLPEDSTTAAQTGAPTREAQPVESSTETQSVQPTDGTLPVEATDKAASDEPKAPDRSAEGGGKAVAAVGAAARATGSLIFQTVMMIIALYFLLLHGNDLVAWLDGVLPLPHGQTRELLTEFKTVSYAVVISTVVTSAVQAVAALIGYFIAGVPHPWFFGSLTFFVAFIPAIGAASVCLVAALILFTTGHPYMALFLAIWGLVVVGLVDNLVKPLLIKNGMKMSGAVVFFALIGGLSAFGTAGLLIGPLVVALFLALLRIYQRDFKKAARA